MSKVAVMREQPMQAHHFVASCEWRWDATTAFHCHAAIGFAHAKSGTSGLRMRLHKGQCVGQCVLAHESVGIEQQHIFTLALADADVVGFGEA